MTDEYVAFLFLFGKVQYFLKKYCIIMITENCRFILDMQWKLDNIKKGTLNVYLFNNVDEVYVAVW